MGCVGSKPPTEPSYPSTRPSHASAPPSTSRPHQTPNDPPPAAPGALARLPSDEKAVSSRSSPIAGSSRSVAPLAPPLNASTLPAKASRPEDAAQTVLPPVSKDGSLAASGSNKWESTGPRPPTPTAQANLPQIVVDEPPGDGEALHMDPLDLTDRVTKIHTKPAKSGGFSDVWEGVLQPEGLKVAIKVLRAVGVEGAKPESGEVKERLDKRLKREMRVWRPLEHSRIVPCLGFAMMDGMPSLVSPWYGNGNAKEYIISHPDCNRRALIVQVAEGLNYLHTRKDVVVHYDLKSPNVLIDDAGEAAITDFGIAKVVEEAHTGLTTSNSTALTIACSSPEAVEGQDRSIQSDVYSFGCFALEIMTDKTPYYYLKGTVNIVRAKYKGEMPDAKKFPKLPESDPLWALLRKCWYKEPLLRPTMTQVLAELKSLGYKA